MTHFLFFLFEFLKVFGNITLPYNFELLKNKNKKHWHARQHG
jgi:hypothetical protein